MMLSNSETLPPLAFSQEDRGGGVQTTGGGTFRLLKITPPAAWQQNLCNAAAFLPLRALFQGLERVRVKEKITAV